MPGMSRPASSVVHSFSYYDPNSLGIDEFERSTLKKVQGGRKGTKEGRKRNTLWEVIAISEGEGDEGYNTRRKTKTKTRSKRPEYEAETLPPQDYLVKHRPFSNPAELMDWNLPRPKLHSSPSPTPYTPSVISNEVDILPSSDLRPTPLPVFNPPPPFSQSMYNQNLSMSYHSNDQLQTPHKVIPMADDKTSAFQTETSTIITNPPPCCPNCSGIVSSQLPHLDPILDLSARLKADPAFWHLNKFQYPPHHPHPLQRDHSFHSVGGFTLNGQYNTTKVKKHWMLSFCSSHKISLVVSTFSLMVTIGLLITLFLMKKRGMMDTMDT